MSSLYLQAILLLLAIAVAQPEDLIVGGYSQIDAKHLDSDAQRVDQFIRQQHPELQGTSIRDVQRQVVAGYNYRFFYVKPINSHQSDQWECVVYEDLKHHLTQTKFDKRKIAVLNGTAGQPHILPDTRQEGKVGAVRPPSLGFTPPGGNAGSTTSSKAGAAPVLSSLGTGPEAVTNELASQVSGKVRKVYRDIFPNAIAPIIL